LTRNSILAGLLLVAGAPILAVPELVPAWIRTPVVASATIAAAVVGLLILRRSHPRAGALAAGLFVTALIGWARAHDAGAVLSHFAGIGAGVLAMGIAASWCVTERRLALAATAFALCGAALLLAGVMGAPKPPSKFFSFPELYEVLPRFFLGLPGLKTSGYVNLNALGGTALLIGPLSAALAIGYFKGAVQSRGMGMLGLAVALLALLVVAYSQSRSAWFAAAALLTMAFLKIANHRVRRVAVVAVVVLASLSVVAVLRSGRPETPQATARPTGTALRSAQQRLAIFRQALDHLRSTPWLGIGLNEFRFVYQPPPGGRRRGLAHAHNIFLQTALDVGLIGLGAYVGLLVLLFARATAARDGPSKIAAFLTIGAAASLLGGLLFGLGDAIALGAKVGIFQWLASGFILAGWDLQRKASFLDHATP
jgi:O-antigen ligase